MYTIGALLCLDVVLFRIHPIHPKICSEYIPRITYMVRTLLCFVVVFAKITPPNHVHGSRCLVFCCGLIQNTSQGLCTQFILSFVLLWFCSEHIPRIMYTVRALLLFVVAYFRLFYPYNSGFEANIRDVLQMSQYKRTTTRKPHGCFLWYTVRRFSNSLRPSDARCWVSIASDNGLLPDRT